VIGRRSPATPALLGLVLLVGFGRASASQADPRDELATARSLLLSEEGFEEGVTRLEALLARAPEPGEIDWIIDARLALGEARLFQGEYPEAEELVRQALPHRADASTWRLLGSICYSQGESIRLDTMRRSASFIVSRYRDAASAFEHATSLDPAQPDGWIGLGLSLFYVPELERAAQAYRTGLDRVAPESSGELYALLGNLLCRYLLQYKEAETVLQRGCDLLPDRSDVRLDLAEARLGLGDEEGAVEALLEGLRIAPANQDVYDRVWQLFGSQRLYDHALAFLERDLAGARAFFEEALRRNPDFATAHGFLARIDLEEGRETEAITALETSLELDRNNTRSRDLLLGLARSRGEAGHYEEALPLFRTLVRLFPRDTTLRADLAVTLASLARGEEAVREYEAALEIDPYDTRLINDLAIVLEAMGRTEEARKAYGRAEELGQNPDAIENLGMLDLRLGHPDRAAAQFTKVLRIDPGRERSLVLLHRCLWEAARKRPPVGASDRIEDR
jgi:tetratricopeptide (TPR) repeat protein